MKVLKFGGTSLGTPERMKEVADIIQSGKPVMVVLSAVAGTTNRLVRMAELLQEGEDLQAFELLCELEDEYESYIDGLFEGVEERVMAKSECEQFYHTLQQCIWKPHSAEIRNLMLAQGELLSTTLFKLYLDSLDLSSALLPALEIMRTDAYGEPDMDHIRDRIHMIMESYTSVDLLITQGYICRDEAGCVSNLQRGGSDYTATLLGASIEAEEVQIWTDIDGLHNNDPRVVKETLPVRHLSYREAAELAYFGAKILHPTCIIPAEKERVPVRLKNTFQPEAFGTLISAASSGKAISAIAAKDGITVIKVRSSRMLNAYGFLRRVFEVFEKYRTPIDMITTSEVAVSLTIDNPAHLEEILEELSPLAELSYEGRQTIICIVGDALNERRGNAKQIFSALEDIPIRMVSYGGSNYNISILINEDYKKEALLSLQRHLFTRKRQSEAVGNK
ncbi:MAG: aspartate kinase [Saprospiraceae bacterium]|nr:aspartate kinase [Saprospiraceae bacterium]